MRTQEEIVNRINERKDEDILGFEVGIYIEFLDFDSAQPFLKPDTTKEQWSDVYKEPTTEYILAKMLGYMSFAWEKANDCRGISANRTIAHYDAWLWLLDDGFLEVINSIEYQHYGKEKLIAICEKYGWDWKQWDNGVRTNCG
jgi:hypothetical protein